jgi:hypothetical protein
MTTKNDLGLLLLKQNEVESSSTKKVEYISFVFLQLPQLSSTA